MSDFYPKIDEKNIKLVKKLVIQNPSYLDHADCPYSDEIKSLFRLLNPIYDFDDTNMDLDKLTNDEEMLREIKSLYTHLKGFGESMRTSDTASEKNTYFKLSASLLEKLILMRERVVNIQKMEVFSDTVIQIMQDELSPDERTRIITRLRKVLDE